MTTPSPFQIPAGATSETSGKPPASTGESKEKSDYSIEDLLLDLNLLPRKRNDKRHKALRLLTSGRLTVLRKDGDLVVAECKGESGSVYSLGYDPRNHEWRCQCDARGECSHLVALKVVAVVGA